MKLLLYAILDEIADEITNGAEFRSKGRNWETQMGDESRRWPDYSTYIYHPSLGDMSMLILLILLSE